MIHRCIPVTLLIASAFWGAGATGQGSLRGLGIFDASEPQTIQITVEVDDSVDSLAILEGPILNALNGDLSTLTGNDADTGMLNVTSGVNNPGGRRLRSRTYTGTCNRCGSGSYRRALNVKIGYTGALKAAVKTWCKDNGKKYDKYLIKGVTYELSANELP